MTGGTAPGAGAIHANDLSGNANTGLQIVNLYLAAGPAAMGREAITEQVGRYLRWLRERTQHITLRGIERSGGAPVVQLPLATAYVPLRARPQARWEDGGAPSAPNDRSAQHAQHARSARSAPTARHEDEPDRDIALDQLLALGPRLVVVGGPGSGKYRAGRSR